MLVKVLLSLDSTTSPFAARTGTLKVCTMTQEARLTSSCLWIQKYRKWSDLLMLSAEMKHLLYFLFMLSLFPPGITFRSLLSEFLVSVIWCLGKLQIASDTTLCIARRCSCSVCSFLLLFCITKHFPPCGMGLWLSDCCNGFAFSPRSWLCLVCFCIYGQICSLSRGHWTFEMWKFHLSQAKITLVFPLYVLPQYTRN